MKAWKSELAKRMQAAGVRIPLDGRPFQFDGRWYVAKFLPTPR